VLLADSALQARHITAEQLAAWRMRRERMAIDSRFWASMSMAAIAAIIALVIVSVVPHYAAKSLPSKLLNTNPSVDANVAAPIAATPRPVHEVDAPVRKAAATSGTQGTASKSDSAKADSSNAAANPKPRHMVQDDYVAPNTYKYYGSGSKGSR
jgi:cytoskeletal protein RodZ